MWQNMADGVALSWQSETTLYSAWSSSASFTPRHILWWTEAAQHVQILWETLLFSTVTLNPNIFIRKGKWLQTILLDICFLILYVKADSGRRCMVEL